MKCCTRFRRSPLEPCAKLQDDRYNVKGDPLKVPLKRKSRDILYIRQFDISTYFIAKIGSYIENGSLQPYAKFEFDIPILSCPIGPFMTNGNLTSGKIILVTPGLGH